MSVEPHPHFAEETPETCPICASRPLVRKLERVCAGKPVPDAFCDQVLRVIDDARAGKVTSLAWVAIGPDFARWGNAFIRGRSDRLNVLGQIEVMRHELVQQELREEE